MIQTRVLAPGDTRLGSVEGSCAPALLAQKTMANHPHKIKRIMFQTSRMWLYAIGESGKASCSRARHSLVT